VTMPSQDERAMTPSRDVSDHERAAMLVEAGGCLLCSRLESAGLATLT
jgi:hypothetical protein